MSKMRNVLAILVLVLNDICTISAVKSFSPIKPFHKSIAKVISSLVISSTFLSSCPSTSYAGMLLFPLPAPLKNNIVLMRAGESYSDSKGLIETNPVKKLLQSNALTPRGREEVVSAAEQLIPFSPTYVWTSNTERAYETATILATQFQLGQNRVVPEFSFLDARAAGAFEGKSIDSWDEIHKHDEVDGINYRPPQTTDGTPSDSVAIVLVRANQLLSTVESMYSGENVVIVSPDSDVLSVLEAALSDENPDVAIPFHAKYHYNTGEYRILHPMVKPSELLVTGQTQDEAAMYSKKMKVLRIVGDSKNFIGKPITSWFDLWHISVDNFE